MKISKEADGEIIYTRSDTNAQSAGDNTIVTPKGGEYQVRLPDGTKVWLNAASSLKYPASFYNHTERRIKLSGEAYFAVAKDKVHPFIVEAGNQEVEVLGTHLNINSYTDEGQIVTTLEEGSVKVRSGLEHRMLIPGQQSVLSENKTLSVQKADLSTALAWRNNEMAFTDATVRQIMRQVSRWYDVNIEYHGAIPHDRITGTIGRRADLATVLKIFATVQIHFSLEDTARGKTLIIRP